MRWIKIDRVELANAVVEFCEKVYPFFRISSEVFLALLGLALPVPSLGFVFRYFSDDFKTLDEGLQSAILVELQSAIVPRVIIFLFVLLMLRFVVERIAKRADQSLALVITKLKKENKKLAQKARRYEFFSQGIGAFVKLYFGASAKKCNLADAERLSFYILERNGFLAISERNASDTELQTIIRETYPVREGIIRMAAKKGSAMVDNLPDYEVDPNGYAERCQEVFNMSRSAVRELSMKARFYYAFRFSSHDNQKYNSMVVIESMTPKLSSKEVFDKVFEVDNDFIYCLVDTFYKQMPRLKNTKGKKL